MSENTKSPTLIFSQAIPNAELTLMHEHGADISISQGLHYDRETDTVYLILIAYAGDNPEPVGRRQFCLKLESCVEIDPDLPIRSLLKGGRPPGQL